mmetsp:Transcript_62997/g.101535  ORF Transcript_62997/g.101535 Transcript_62997/m.101535 type:complete len:80 (-) Transcript_62997:186-425(-)
MEVSRKQKMQFTPKTACLCTPVVFTDSSKIHSCTREIGHHLQQRLHPSSVNNSKRRRGPFRTQVHPISTRTGERNQIVT